MDTNNLYVVQKPSDSKFIIIEGESNAALLTFKLGYDATYTPFHKDFDVFDDLQYACNKLGLEYVPNQFVYVKSSMCLNWPLCNTSLENKDIINNPHSVAPCITKHLTYDTLSPDTCLFTPFIENHTIFLNINLSLYGTYEKDVSLILQKDILKDFIGDVLLVKIKQEGISMECKTHNTERIKVQSICEILQGSINDYDIYSSKQDNIYLDLDLNLRLVNHLL
jgi:hypothetical protein